MHIGAEYRLFLLVFSISVNGMHMGAEYRLFLLVFIISVRRCVSQSRDAYQIIWLSVIKFRFNQYLSKWRYQEKRLNRSKKVEDLCFLDRSYVNTNKTDRTFFGLNYQLIDIVNFDQISCYIFMILPIMILATDDSGAHKFYLRNIILLERRRTQILLKPFLHFNLH